MAAGRIFLPNYMPAADANGDRIAGAKAYFYQDLTTTLATTYTTSGLSVANANPVVADSAGIWPEIWADTATVFTVALTDSSGAPLPNGNWSGVSPSIDATLASVALAESAADRAEAAASGFDVVATSASSLTIGTGSKSLDVEQLGNSFAVGMPVRIAMTAAATNYMDGVITAFAEPAMTVNVTSTNGAGSATAWTLSALPLAGVKSIAGQTGDLTASATKTALSLQNVDNTAVLGRHALWVPATAMVTRATNGAAVSLTESTTNKVMRQTLDFDASTVEYAQFTLRMPKSWDEGTVSFVPVWSHGSTTTNFKVRWDLQAVALSDDDAGDAAFGTAAASNDTGGTTDDIYVGPESAAITIAGTPAAEDLVVFQIFRKADDATNDTLAVDAKLLGLTLYLTNNAGTDA